MSRPAYFVGPWDLNRSLPCVPEKPAEGTVVLVESVQKGRAMPFHKKKLVFVLSAMHHFAEELRDDGFDVEIVHADTYVEGIAEHVRTHASTKVIAMMPREYGLWQAMLNAQEEDALGAPLELHDDGGEGSHFVLRRDAFAAWASGRKLFRMADFYKMMRKQTGYLMAGPNAPEGGKWSYDDKNREHARGQQPPAAERHPPDALTADIMKRVSSWSGRWGDVEGFDWPVTRAAALVELERFFEHRAANFGRYQDAMLAGEPYMWHALISAAINVSLISPREVCERIVQAYAHDRMPLAAAEGLLRQILGWREFIRGIYWHRMPQLRDSNLLGASRKLPDFFWEPEKTDMVCLRDSIGQVKRTGYGHHIQRLMVQGNFALLAGIAPLEISHWFWAAFVDAYEWVELPNVHGMAIYADDTFTTKPYAASGNYIKKMSNYCSSCRYDVKKRTGDDACPFNALYWSFMDKHRERFVQNPRMGMLYRTWDRFGHDEQAAIRQSANKYLTSLSPPDVPWTFDDDAC